MPNRPGNDDRLTGGVGSSEGTRQPGQNAQTSGLTGGQATGGSQRTRSNRGFASMDREKQREIASKGGKAAHAKGTAHEFDSGEAREAGRKGGQAVSRNRDHMAAIGRRGGEARGHARGRATTGANTGATATGTEGSFQNSRTTPDREVPLNERNQGVNANTQGTRGGTSPLGGERRPAGETRDISGNH
jgi:general stress protein YciG